MAFGGTVDYLVDTVFNYPTLAESYKVAALDAQNKLHAPPPRHRLAAVNCRQAHRGRPAA